MRSTLMVLPGRAGAPGLGRRRHDGTCARRRRHRQRSRRSTPTAQYVDRDGPGVRPEPRRRAAAARTSRTRTTPTRPSLHGLLARVTLHDLDGSGQLIGTWARSTRLTGGVAARARHRTSSTCAADDRFEQVDGVLRRGDRLQAYLHGSASPTSTPSSRTSFIDTIPDDNSFYSPSADTITLGRGGVDDAEDIEVIWHESGHAVQDDQVPGFGTTRAGRRDGRGLRRLPRHDHVARSIARTRP